MAGVAAAQQPTRPDTARPAVRDTGAVRPDTGAAAADTGKVPRDTTPPPQLPTFTQPVAPGFADQVWVWDRDAIERFADAMTLGDLLETIPGITRIRSGYMIQPEGVSAFGQAGGRLEVFLDGFELAPLSSGVPDLSRIELAELSSIRVERRLDVLRIDLRSFQPFSAEPYALIEAAVGEPGGKLFRGLFLAPHLFFGPLAVGVDRLDTDLNGGAGSQMGVWGKWSAIRRDRGGIQAEFRTNSVDRTSVVPWVGSYGRTDWTIRARWRFPQGLLAEAYYGTSSESDPHLVPDSTGFGHLWTAPTLPTPTTAAESLAVDSLTRTFADSVTLNRTDHQAGLRLGYARGLFWAEAAGRTHTAPHLPHAEGDLTAGVRLGERAELDGSVSYGDWAERKVTDTRVRARAGPVAGFTAFAEAARGARGIPYLTDATGRDLFTDRTAWRAGIDFERAWGAGGIARVYVKSDSTAPFGLPFDLQPTLYPTGTMTGWESHGRLRLLWKPLSAEFWYLAWTRFTLPDSAVKPLYTPEQQWRASLVYHQLPLASGHLEIYARLDARSRGIMDVATPQSGGGRTVPAMDGIDFYLQIRVLDLRMFFQERDITQNRTQAVYDILPGQEIPAPRIFYGVRWQFFN